MVAREGVCYNVRMDRHPLKIWRCRGRDVSLGAPLVMGIVNVTPDSFHAAARTPGTDAAVARGVRLARAGAAILDVGGESTRPGAEPVDAAAEIARVVPVLAALREALPGILLSVDTRHAATARAALAVGADIVNDVDGCAPDPGMARAIAETGAGYVLMHSRGDPATMDGLTDYADVVGEVEAALREASARLAAAGADPRQIVWDPGLGFAKTHADSWRLLEATGRLAADFPVLIGASRKRFLAPGLDAAARGPASVAAARRAVALGAAGVRVQDVAQTVAALRREGWGAGTRA